MTLILRCKSCGEIVRYEPEPEQSMYGAAYVAGLRHEKNYRGQCETGAARYLVLIGIEQGESNAADEHRSPERRAPR